MEDTLRDRQYRSEENSLSGLNPCFNGRYSQRKVENQVARNNYVLILVLMEDTLRGVCF